MAPFLIVSGETACHAFLFCNFIADTVTIVRMAAAF